MAVQGGYANVGIRTKRYVASSCEKIQLREHTGVQSRLKCEKYNSDRSPEWSVFRLRGNTGIQSQLKLKKYNSDRNPEWSVSRLRKHRSPESAEIQLRSSEWSVSRSFNNKLAIYLCLPIIHYPLLLLNSSPDFNPCSKVMKAL